MKVAFDSRPAVDPRGAAVPALRMVNDGAAALVLSINPALKGHPDQIAQILRATAARTGVTDPIAQTCGGTLASQWPNNMLGYGRVDAYAAAVMADTLFKDGFDGAAAN